MPTLDPHTIGTELRLALLAFGIAADRIVVRSEPAMGQSWTRVTVVIGAQSIDVHTLDSYWPPVASTARSLRWVVNHGHRAPLYGTASEWAEGFRRMSVPTAKAAGDTVGSIWLTRSTSIFVAARMRLFIRQRFRARIRRPS